MLRFARVKFQVARPLATHSCQARRSLVSPVLLTRTWENESIASLRREAKNRGLPAKGSKANLILRITEYDTIKVSSEPPAPTPANARSASSSATPLSHTVAPGPGVPTSAATTAPPSKHQLLNVVIPNTSEPDPEPPVEVPYVPDFWDSTAFEKQPPPVDSEELPKMFVVGGLSHDDNGPTYNLQTVHESETVVVTTPGYAEGLQSQEPSSESGLLEDITQDLGIPPPGKLKQSIWKLFS